MLREQVQAAVRNVITALDASGVISLLEAFIVPSERKLSSSQQVLEAFSELKARSESFGKAEEKIIDVFRIGDIFNSQWWASLLGVSNAGERAVTPRTVLSRLSFVHAQLPKLLTLLETEASRIKQETSGHERPSSDQEILQLILIEQQSERSTPHRVIISIEAIAMLYEAAADVARIRPNSLVLLGCDSGSDKAFDFLGIAQAINAVKETILAVWDRVVFFRERRLEVGIDLLAKSLPLVEAIEKMNGNGISPEECELLKRKVIGGVERFLEAGCTIPEIDRYTQFSPRQLLAPSPKLLAAPSKEEDDASATSISPNPSPPNGLGEAIEGLTPSQVRAIAAILQRADPPSGSENNTEDSGDYGESE